MTAFDTVTARLAERTGGTGRNGDWPCPAHEDNTPSLSVSPGNEGVVLYCHAGCATEAVVAALGLTMADLFDTPRSNGSDITATYDYVDEQGTLLFQVVRKIGKKFVQRRPDGNGGWVWNIHGVRRVLYRLPDVVRGVREGIPVFVVEGEKDADRLHALGVPATTNPHGAGKWRTEYNASLAGADVVIVADRDDAGRAHAHHIAQQLNGIAARVRTFEPVEGKDISDHLAAGHKVKELNPVDLEADTTEPDDTLGALPDGHRATDVGNATRLLELADGKLRHVHAWGKWLVWRDGRWIIDEGDVLVTEFAKRVARRLFKMTADITGDKDLRERAWNWAVHSERSGAITAMVRLARGAPGILVEHEQLDADPYLLNVLNGTIDLRTGQLRPADPADLMTVQCPVAYDPGAVAPVWRACLNRWQPDPAVRRYVRHRAGAAATGIPTETVDVDYGTGANGKSKFWGAIQHVLGDYTVVPHKSLLVAQRHEQHATVVARLFRKRLAVASETKAADVLDDEQVKNLTGGDRLSGRRMREDPWEFQPSHTLVMFSNHRPTIQGRDEGIWRRLRLVPWEITIPEDERDDDLAAKLQAEAPGILAWVVKGARYFIVKGLTPPTAVRAATDRYRADEDVIGRFIADVLRIGDGWAFSSDIKAELDAWCDDNGIEPPRLNEVTEVLRNIGCRDGGRRKIAGKRSTIWHGVTITEIGAKTL
jgi:putative DNA primase/helicase